MKYSIYGDHLGNCALNCLVICFGGGHPSKNQLLSADHKIQSRKDVLPLDPTLSVSLKHVE